MNAHLEGPTRRFDGGAVLAIGFGTAAAQWVLGYLLHLPFLQAPSPLVLVVMLLLLVIGGVLAGRHAAGPLRSAAAAGAVAMGADLLVLGSLLAEGGPEGIMRRAALWIPGALLFGAAVALIGGWIGARQVRAHYDAESWNGRFAVVAATATLAMMAIGGLVTSHEAGMAVPDWPRTFGSNMFLYPLSRMTGGIYYEHAHRLFGALVGLTTVVLSIRLWAIDRRRWIKGLGSLAVLLVVAQGVMGGLRVTQASLPLAVAHGITGQLFFALIAALAAFCTTRWRAPATSGGVDGTRDRSWVVGMVGLLVGQLALGAIVRHTGQGVMPHILVAVIVAGVALRCGVRAWFQHHERPPLPALGVLLCVCVSVQAVLGFAAWVATSRRALQQNPAFDDLLFTTWHQFNGAVLLGVATLFAVWTFRLLPHQLAGSRGAELHPGTASG